MRSQPSLVRGRGWHAVTATQIPKTVSRGGFVFNAHRARHPGWTYYNPCFYYVSSPSELCGRSMLLSINSGSSPRDLRVAVTTPRHKVKHAKIEHAKVKHAKAKHAAANLGCTAGRHARALSRLQHSLPCAHARQQCVTCLAWQPQHSLSVPTQARTCPFFPVKTFPGLTSSPHIAEGSGGLPCVPCTLPCGSDRAWPRLSVPLICTAPPWASPGLAGRLPRRVLRRTAVTPADC
eukprot:363618-Chlamydomonas_euryale.AAC.17